ncbi:MAG: hypothetical protein GY832_22095 [Chloroflexi bacterium]|nr:hypothetical protein [Chloroflexota bacterium]
MNNQIMPLLSLGRVDFDDSLGMCDDCEYLREPQQDVCLLFGPLPQAGIRHHDCHIAQEQARLFAAKAKEGGK